VESSLNIELQTLKMLMATEA